MIDLYETMNANEFLNEFESIIPEQLIPRIEKALFTMDDLDDGETVHQLKETLMDMESDIDWLNQEIDEASEESYKREAEIEELKDYIRKLESKICELEKVNV